MFLLTLRPIAITSFLSKDTANQACDTMRPLQHDQLMSERRILCFKPTLRFRQGRPGSPGDWMVAVIMRALFDLCRSDPGRAAEPPAEAAATCASAAALSAATAGLGHVDPDRLRHDRGIVRHMIFVAEQELKRMPPW